MRTNDSLKRMIPLTALRHFYELLRRFPSFAFRLQAARECVRRPEQLQELVQASSDHFAHYENAEEPFHFRSQGELTADRFADDSIASHLLRNVIAGACSVPEAPLLDFDYVDYEVSPIRTTGSQFENGITGRRSGTGGIDLLMANRSDRLPIVAEVKVETDTDPFFGLIQALLYTVEMTSPSQMARIARFYGNHFTIPEDGPLVDVYLMLVTYPDDEKHAESLQLTDQLAGFLLTDGTPVARLVRRLVCLETSSVDKGTVAFTVRFAHQVGGTIIPTTH